jgi:hypothetical protein
MRAASLAKLPKEVDSMMVEGTPVEARQAGFELT